MRLLNCVFSALLGGIICFNAICANETSETEEFSEVGVPDDVFSGLYLGVGLGYDSLDNKYEITPLQNADIVATIGKKGSISTHAYNIYGIGGFGGVFGRFWYAGAESELFFRRGGSTDECKGVRVENKNTYGFNFKIRGGYIFRPVGLLAYFAAAAERSINHISIIKDDNKYCGDCSYGSYHPTLAIGIEKKIRNNWSVRAELAYTIGIWDDTGRRFLLPTNEANKFKPVPFKAKANKKTLKIMLCKYL